MGSHGPAGGEEPYPEQCPLSQGGQWATMVSLALRKDEAFNDNAQCL